MSGQPKYYRSIEEFEREELQPHNKLGWSLDDLYQEATFQPGQDDSLDDGGVRELDFD
ncbi:MAG: hypothetical protein ACPGUV_08385 [Polyangiales bacterium]